jgi:purine-nucleoside phosphorylase
MTDYESVTEAAAYIRGRTAMEPRIGLILGSGLGGIVEHMTATEMIPYEDIPGFPASRVAGHAARLVFGYLGDQAIVAMQGRFHFYEGHSMRELCFPIFVLCRLGVENLIVTNACGGINAAFTPGDLMLITDHINLLGNNPLIGPNDERFGPRFPDMTEVYSKRLLRLADETAKRLEIPVRHGVYALFPGPCYETAAEIRAYRVLGADAIGMSTVPETTAARYLGMEVLGIACITNMATGIAASPHSHEEVLAVAEMSSRKLCALVEEIIGNWPAEGR